jgi:hypothetical protein
MVIQEKHRRRIDHTQIEHEVTMPAHSIEAIQNTLRRGLTPVTENREALLQLGFSRAYPQIVHGYEASLWERAVEHPQRTIGGSRRLVRERAILALQPLSRRCDN